MSRAVFFSTVVAAYVALDRLNLEQAAQIGTLGIADLLAVSAWTMRRGGESKLGRVCVTATFFVFIVLMSYLGFLREYFGVAADDASVLAAIFGSDRSEAGEFLQHHARQIFKHAAIAVALTAAFAFLLGRWPLARRPGTPAPSSRAGWTTVAACMTAFALAHVNTTMRNLDPLLYFSSRYAAWRAEVRLVSQVQEQMERTLSDPRLDTLRRADDSPRTVVFMLSESITRQNFPYAGYPRGTTPELDRLGTELTWFTDVLASDPSTFPALCNLLTPSTLAKPHLWLARPDLLLMARKAGYETFWISNHSTDANGLVSIFASHANHVVLANRGKSRGEGSFDEVLLPHLEQALRDPSPHKLIFVHLLGAHPAYYYRYPRTFARFNHSEDPVARGLRAAGRAPWAVAMRNFYDNALLYNDHILKRSLDLCRASGGRVAWLFAPDHGQDVAHVNNFSGHNARAPSQYEIPVAFWRSEAFPAPAVPAPTLASRPYQMDVLDHTLLGLMGIQGFYYDPRNDLLSESFQPALRSVNGKPWQAQTVAASR